MDTTRILENLKTEFFDIDPATVETELSTVDADTLLAEERARYNVRVWDRISPINGYPAERFLARDDVPDEGDIYLIEKDGALLYFQPHAFNGGPIPAGSGLDAGNEHIDLIANDEASMKVLDRANARLRKLRDDNRSDGKKKVEALQATVDQLVLDQLMGGMA